MNRSHVIILLAVALALAGGIDLTVTLRTGRARGRWSGTMTREKQPKRFWRYVSFPKIISGRIDGAARTRLGWRQ